MKAVIVAAGKGTRLSTTETLPKPLTPILGVPLLVRVIRNALLGGANKVVVVLGYRAEEIQKELQRLPDNIKKNIEIIFNKRFEESNGLSILSAEEIVKDEDFLVLMSDHLAPPTVISSLIDFHVPVGGAVLAVDTRINEIPDLDDATKVVTVTEESCLKIKKIGKTLNEFVSIDMGCFKMTQGIFSALRESESRGDTSISGAIKILSERGVMNALIIDNAEWVDVDTPEMIPYAENFLLSQLVKGRDGPVSRLFNRPVSLFFTRRLARINFSPNAGTLLAVLFGVSAALLIGTKHFILGGIFVHLHSVVDGIDGEIARLKFKTSYLGAWLDRHGDMLGEYSIFLGIAYGTGEWIWTFGALLTNILYVGAGDSLTALGLILGETWKPAKTLLPQFARCISRDVMLFLLAILTLLGDPEIFLPILVLGRGAYLLIQSFYFGKATNVLRKL